MRSRSAILVAFVLLVTLVLVPLAGEAQQPGAMPRIGVVVPVEPESPTEPNVGAFRQGLRDLGYVEGHNIIVEYRYALGNEALYAVTNMVSENVMLCALTISTPSRGLQRRSIGDEV
jgi:hypothetical protein